MQYSSNSHQIGRAGIQGVTGSTGEASVSRHALLTHVRQRKIKSKRERKTREKEQRIRDQTKNMTEKEKVSLLLGCDAALLGKWVKTFREGAVVSS